MVYTWSGLGVSGVSAAGGFSDRLCGGARWCFAPRPVSLRWYVAGQQCGALMLCSGARATSCGALSGVCGGVVVASWVRRGSGTCRCAVVAGRVAAVVRCRLVRGGRVRGCVVTSRVSGGAVSLALAPRQRCPDVVWVRCRSRWVVVVDTVAVDGLLGLRQCDLSRAPRAARGPRRCIIAGAQAVAVPSSGASWRDVLPVVTLSS